MWLFISKRHLSQPLYGVKIILIIDQWSKRDVYEYIAFHNNYRSELIKLKFHTFPP